MAASQTTPWRLISGILGVTCLVLMTIWGILFKNSFTDQSSQSASSPRPAIETQEGSDCCSCQEKWIGYQCKCYFISNERKTWAESRDFCTSQNSSLLQLQNRDELHFLNYSLSFYWIGLCYSEPRGAWVWEDGSALSQDQFPVSHFLNTQNCIMYGTSRILMDEPCGKKNRYICMKQLSLGVSLARRSGQ